MNTSLTPWMILTLNWGWALLHTLWMLAVIGIATALVLTWMRRAAASARYNVLIFAMALMALSPVLALWWVTPSSEFERVWQALMQAPTPAHASSRPPMVTLSPAGLASRSFSDAGEAVLQAPTRAANSAGVPFPLVDLRQRAVALLTPALPWIVVLWALGVFFVSLRLSLGGICVFRLRRRGCTQVPDAVLESVARLSSALSLAEPVRVMKSALIEVPAVIGWIKPVILLPPSALAGLTPLQLEMVLAHELAHLVRHDPVVNAIQAVVEAMLFYHPAVWWVTRRIREERELCCDDRALLLCADRQEYARALYCLELQRSQPALVGLSAAGAPLLQRIRRVLTPAPLPDSGRWGTGIALLLVLTAGIGLVAVQTGSVVLAQPEEVLPSAPQRDPASTYAKVTFPSSPVGVICGRQMGTSSFYDWREMDSAAGSAWLPEGAEYALRVAPQEASDLSFLDRLSDNAFAGLLLGVFRSFRAGNETAQQVYPDLLQTAERTRMPVYDSDIPRVARFTGLRDLYLDHSFVGDAGIAALAELSSLETLSLVDTEISDDALRSLGQLPALKQLNLNETRITDQGLAYLAEIPSLEDLSLDRTAVSDAGVALLAALPNLRRLSLNFTAVTDAGVAPLDALESLESLRTWRTAVSSAAHGSGATQYGLSAPRVGILFSDFNAHTGRHQMQNEYTYRNALAYAEVLIDLGYDLYAVIEPGTEDAVYLPEVLTRLGLEDRAIVLSNQTALRQLDVIFSAFDADVLDSTLAALGPAIKAGVGFVNTSLFGAVVPGSGPELSEILGMDNVMYRCPTGYLECPVVNSHPILGDLQPGDTFVANMVNGFDGTLRGTPLVGKPWDKPETAWPLYVYDLGRGRVVNLQCQKISVTNGSVSPFDLYRRCINFAAKLPVDGTW